MSRITDNPVFCALDMQEVRAASAMAEELAGKVGGLKLGLEFFMANGPDGIRSVTEAAGLPYFLDLKLHDIPNTVAGAVRSVMPLEPNYLSIHTTGGPAMMEAAVKAARQAGNSKTRILGITVLTSLDGSDLNAVGVNRDPGDQVEALACLAKDCGLDGVVCSPMEVARLRSICGPEFDLVIPGIRPAGAEVGDQKRVMTPSEALTAGADVLVIGRAITQAIDPAAAAAAIAADIAGR